MNRNSFPKHINNPAFDMKLGVNISSMSKDVLDDFNNGVFDKLLSDIIKKWEKENNKITLGELF